MDTCLAYVYLMFHVLFHHFHEIVTVAVSQTGCQCIDVNEPSRYLLTGGSDGIISVWDLKTKKVRKTYKVSKDSSNTCLKCFHTPQPRSDAIFITALSYTHVSHTLYVFKH